MNLEVSESWRRILEVEFEKEYYKKLTEFVESEYLENEIYPPKTEIFNAFNKCAYEDVKVVILGQDPYHGPGQANGLCFSVREDVRIPPSLKNIFKEIKSDLGADVPSHGSLERWAEQGVLLLNATLTVRAQQAGSHQKKGWEQFTDAVIRQLGCGETTYRLHVMGQLRSKESRADHRRG